MGNEQFDDSNLIYDLRQYYANIVGQHLVDVMEARKERNYQKYFIALEDLHTVISHKALKKLKDRKIYRKLKKDFIIISNKNTSAYLGQSTSAKEVAEIEIGLRKIERFLYKKMDMANMMGSQRDDRGL